MLNRRAAGLGSAWGVYQSLCEVFAKAGDQKPKSMRRSVPADQAYLHGFCWIYKKNQMVE